MQPEIASPSSRPASSPISATKRLAPHCSVQSQPAAVEQVSGTASAKAALKRRAALTLSDRFAAGGTGNPIPVITDQAPVKKRRMPEPDPEKEYEEDFEMQVGTKFEFDRMLFVEACISVWSVQVIILTFWGEGSVLGK